MRESIVEKLSKIPDIFDHSIDPAGDFIAYISNISGIPQIYIQSIKEQSGSNPKRLTSSEKGTTRFFLSPDGKFILFTQDSGGNEMDLLFLLEIETGKIREITDTGVRTMAIAWNPNYSLYNEIVRCYVSHDGFILEIIDLETKSKKILRKFSMPIFSTSFCPVGRMLAVTRMTRKMTSETIIIDKKEPDKEILYDYGGFPSWSPNGKQLAILSDTGNRRQIIVQELEGSEKFTMELDSEEEIDGDFSKPIWGPSGKKLYYQVSCHSRITICSHSIESRKKKFLPFPKGTVILNSNPINKSGTIITAVHSSIKSPPSIYLHEIGTDSVSQITEKTDFVDFRRLFEPEYISYRTFDSRTIYGWFIPSVKNNGGIPNGLIIAHGGPYWQFFDSFETGKELLPLSLSGFNILAPNYRGSTGYGEEFKNLNKGDIGGGDLEDIIYGVGFLRSRNIQKIGISGGSYGGYLTLMALSKKPEIFKVGVSMVPITDLIEVYNKSDPAYRAFFGTLLGGTPENKRKLYEDRSPITHINKIKAPLMIMAAKSDSRTPFEPIEKYIKKLREMNHPHEFFSMDDVGHLSLSNVSLQVVKLTKMVEYLKNNM